MVIITLSHSIKSDINTDIKGVRIAVREMYKNSENQIYDWGIKKESSLDGVVAPNTGSSHGVSSEDSFNRNSLDGVVQPQNGNSHGVSSEVPDNNISLKTQNINTPPGNSIENISTEIPEFKTGIDSENINGYNKNNSDGCTNNGYNPNDNGRNIRSLTVNGGTATAPKTSLRPLLPLAFPLPPSP